MITKHNATKANYFSCLEDDNKEVVSGYEIRYNPFWGEWQVSHPEIGVCESFTTLGEAVNYATRGKTESNES